MDNITDFLKTLKDRLTSPFISSFILSWIFFNWKVSVALLWYDKEQFGKATIFEFIENNTNNLNSIIYPLLVALGYTFVYPFFRTLISGFQTFVLKLEENWTLDIAKGQKIPMEKYLKLREDYLKNSKNLEDIIVEEGKDRQKVIDAEKKNLDLLDEIGLLTSAVTNNEMKLKEYAEKLSSFRNVFALDGHWIFTVKNGQAEKQMNLEIKGGTISVVKDNGERLQAYMITHFYHDTHNKPEMFFVKVPHKIAQVDEKYLPTRKRPFFATALTYEFNEWRGSENNDSEVTYRKSEKAFTTSAGVNVLIPRMTPPTTAK